MALVVLTGGARSGKSSIAQELARSRALDGTAVTVVVFGVGTGDVEMADRIERHRSDRPETFRVVEATGARSWTSEVAADGLLVLDCLGTLTSRAFDEALSASEAPEEPGNPREELPSGLADHVEETLGAVVDWLVARSADTIVVTNEVGDGVVPEYPSGRLFRDSLGRTNRRLVAAADAAYLVVCGRAFDLTAMPTTVRWPSD